MTEKWYALSRPPCETTMVLSTQAQTDHVYSETVRLVYDVYNSDSTVNIQLTGVSLYCAFEVTGLTALCHTLVIILNGHDQFSNLRTNKIHYISVINI